MTENSNTEYRDNLYTIKKDGSRKWVYTQHITGYFNNRRTLVAFLLLIFYLAMPWIEINGMQAVRLDIPGRHFTFFGTTFWATDTQYLFLIFGILGISLFFFTALVGRVWCGWACPETVFLEFVFRPIEKLIEGDGAKRLRLDQAPWTVRKILLKTLKFTIFAFICWFLSSTALAYFVGREELIGMITGNPFNNWGMFLLTLFLSGILFFQFAWFREQFCSLLCPYARFQSVLMDKDSLQVGYDPLRGEPRGKRKKNNSETEKLGDCIDCGLCVRVCPAGIDIRNGLQLECIQCALCIDACDSIMKKVGSPSGLIRYDSESSLLTKSATHWFRPRILIYGSIFVLLSGLLTYRLIEKQDSEFKVVRNIKVAPFTVSEDGLISNQYELKISNKSKVNKQYKIELTAASSITLTTPINPAEVKAESIATFPIFIRFDKKDVGSKVVLSIYEGDSYKETKEVPLIGP